MAEHVIKLPDVGEGAAEAELVEWHVKVGDLVREDTVLAGVMTGKATVEIPSPLEGKVHWLGGEIGETIVRIEVAASSSGNASLDAALPMDDGQCEAQIADDMGDEGETSRRRSRPELPARRPRNPQRQPIPSDRMMQSRIASSGTSVEVPSRAATLRRSRRSRRADHIPPPNPKTPANDRGAIPRSQAQGGGPSSTATRPEAGQRKRATDPERRRRIARGSRRQNPHRSLRRSQRAVTQPRSAALRNRNVAERLETRFRDPLRARPDRSDRAVVVIATISPISPSESRKISLASFSSERSEARARGNAPSRLSRSVRNSSPYCHHGTACRSNRLANLAGLVDEVKDGDLADQDRRNVELTADPPQEGKNRLDVAGPAA